jgi:hypothetical protein
MAQTPTELSRPSSRELAANDVMFLLGIAFIVIAFAVTIVVRHN